MPFLHTQCSYALQKRCTEEYLFLEGDFNHTELDLDGNHVEPRLPSRKHLIKVNNRHELGDVAFPWQSKTIHMGPYTR